jgi:hypothetical protein
MSSKRDGTVAISPDVSGYNLAREIEEYLFDVDNVRGQEFFWRAKNEATITTRNGEYVGYCKNKILELAIEFGVEIKEHEG